MSGRVVKTSIVSPCEPAIANDDARAFRAPDPILLHQPHPLGPAVEPRQRLQQRLGIRRDPQKPLRQEPLFDRRRGPPAAAVDHLLVGEDGVLDRVPIDPGFLAVGEAGREEIEKHFLFVAVVLRMAGGDLARPVIGKAHALELGAHRRDVAVGPDCRMRCFRRSPHSPPAGRRRPSPSDGGR